MTGIYITIIVQALISIGLLYHSKNGDKKYNFLYLYLLVITADFLFELFIYHFFNRNASSIESIPSSFRVLKGPLLLLFCLSAMGKKISNRFIGINLLPFLLLFLCNLVIFSNVLSRSLNGNLLFNWYQQAFSFYPYYWLSYVMVTFYCINNAKQPLNTELKYFKALVVYLMLSILAYYITLKMGMDRELLRTIYTYLFLVQFAIIIVMKLKNIQVKLSLEPEKRKAEKYKTSNLSKETLTNIAEGLLKALKTRRLYLNEDITLEEVARQLNVSKHHLSQSITEGLNTNFYDLINKCRVEEFTRIINEDPALNVSEVFYQCGFKSRTTFYKYFKKHMGQNPTDYKEQLVQDTGLHELVNV